MHHFVRVGVVPEPVLPGQDVSGPQVPLLRRRPLLLLRRLRVRLSDLVNHGPYTGR